ncbi:MAG TPA: hypothetical protein VMW27_07405 [Thermoanaerobaculia bacterium]|nr:hypothetical protein [Thermoanaerobaculia bacterium]
MPRFRIAVTTLPALLALALAGAAAQPQPQQPPLPEKFVANSINLGGVAKPDLIFITIQRWSTPEERQTLVDAFRQKGPKGLLQTLQKMKTVGSARSSKSMGWDLYYAAQSPTEGGGRRIFLATDRRMGHLEIQRSTKSEDYPFTLIELRLNGESKGEGALSYATKIGVSKDGSRIELEGYDMEPLRLQNVRKEK